MGGGASKPQGVAADALLEGLAYDKRIGAVTGEEAIECIALAFAGTATAPKEELMNWILGPRFAAFDSPERMAMCKYNGKWAVTACTKKGTVVGLRDPETKEVLGVMALRRTPETMSEMMSTMSKCGNPPHMSGKEPYGKEPMKRDEAVEKGMKKLAQKGPQYILYALSVKPAHQGKGVARALVNALFACADRDQVPAYVDCVGERLVKLYSHLGFEKHAEAEVVDPTKQEGGEEKIVMTSLMRKPAPPP